LEFYNDEEEHIQRPRRLAKPRSRKYESKEEFDARIREWEALLPHEQVVKPKGNGMTQKYYTERLLLVYIDAVQNHGFCKRIMIPRMAMGLALFTGSQQS
jgi:hypothetical protein